MTKSAISVDDLRRIAKRRLPKSVFDLIDGGADAESALARNRADLDAIVLPTRVLRNVDNRTSATTILGRPMDFPYIISPTGMAALTHPKADLLLAQAAQARNIPFVTSSSSSFRLEETYAAAPDARHWFQALPYRSEELALSLLRRAHDTGYEAIVLTVDTPVIGLRRRDLRNRFALPLRPTARLAFDMLRCPSWSFGVARNGIPRLVNFETPGKVQSAVSLAAVAAANVNAGFDWDAMARMRDRWPGKFLIKGILHPADAEEAARRGADAVVVSNHGGRQFDAAPSPIAALPAIAAAVSDRMEVILDGGIKQGVDIVRALAAGAHAVMAGRPTLWGMAALGANGAGATLDMLHAEFDRALALLGCSTPADIPRLPAV